MKAIERCRELCAKEEAKLKEKYHEAQMNYQDTGISRYYNQMCKYEDALEELEKFINGADIAKADAKRYKRMYEELSDSLYYIRTMMNNLTDEDFTSPRVAEILNQLARL